MSPGSSALGVERREEVRRSAESWRIFLDQIPPGVYDTNLEKKDI